MRVLSVLVIMLLDVTAFSQDYDLPPNPEAGKCYVKYYVVKKKKKIKWKELHCALVNFQTLDVRLENSNKGLSDKDRKVIDKELVPFIKKGYTLNLRSHYVSNETDSINVKLSSQRAIVIGNYLIDNGMNPELLVVNSLGNSEADKTMLEYRIINASIE